MADRLRFVYDLERGEWRARTERGWYVLVLARRAACCRPDKSLYDAQWRERDRAQVTVGREMPKPEAIAACRRDAETRLAQEVARG